MKMSESKIEAQAIAPKTPSVLGRFTGKCCDANIFNNNDMHISREVFEKLMDSDEYKRAMKYRHYIGYGGHPENTDCQDFEHACIVMTDMRITDSGEIEGDFDLVNTPVGRIIKAFIDSGVQFGISIRGLGEVEPDGEVDPDEFIFRGFDLVTFPAYDDCIPEFKEIAASTDFKKQAKYKKVCASIDTNLESIQSCEALKFIQEQLPDDSDEFNKVQDRIDAIENNVEDNSESDIEEGGQEMCEDCTADILEITEQKLAAMTELYLDAAQTARELETKLLDQQVANNELAVECKTLKNKQARLDRIVAAQIEDANRTANNFEIKYNRSVDQTKSIRASLDNAKQDLANTRGRLKTVNSRLAEMKEAYNAQIQANTELKDRLSSINNTRRADLQSVKATEELNLKYKRKIEANSKAISQKDSTIEDLKSKLNETVANYKNLESKASNLDETNAELLSRVEAAEEMVTSYQQAYANIYANALGVYLKDLPVTAATSVEELAHMIKAGTSTAGIPSTSIMEDEDAEYDDNVDESFDASGYSAEMVTL